MDLASALGSVKLKKTAGPPPATGPVERLCEDSDAYNRLMAETKLEEYLDALHPSITFATELLPLGAAQADLHSAHRALKRPWNTVESLQKLADDIDAVAKRRGWKTFFVRLSTRSPKDAALSRPRFPALLAEHYKRVVDETDVYQLGTNEKLLALYAASTEAMAMRSGAEAVALLVVSERIQEDLVAFSELNLCVREFWPFRPELETRGFVWEGRMTALTQYCQFVASPIVKNHRGAIEAACQRCFEQYLQQQIPLTRYAVDFVVLEEGDEFRAMVVEVNPLAEFTGMGLFEWPRDQDVIRGRAPFEYRIVEEPPAVLDIAPDYRAILDKWPCE